MPRKVPSKKGLDEKPEVQTTQEEHAPMVVHGLRLFVRAGSGLRDSGLPPSAYSDYRHPSAARSGVRARV